MEMSVEAVVHALQIAVEYRQKYNKDVFIDLLYRSMDIMKEMNHDLLNLCCMK